MKTWPYEQLLQEWKYENYECQSGHTPYTKSPKASRRKTQGNKDPVKAITKLMREVDNNRREYLDDPPRRRANAEVHEKKKTKKERRKKRSSSTKFPPPDIPPTFLSRFSLYSPPRADFSAVSLAVEWQTDRSASRQTRWPVQSGPGGR